MRGLILGLVLAFATPLFAENAYMLYPNGQYGQRGVNGAQLFPNGEYGPNNGTGSEMAPDGTYVARPPKQPVDLDSKMSLDLKEENK